MNHDVVTDKHVKNINLKDQNEHIISLADIKGKRALLSFHPLAWTSVCAQQMKDLNEAYDKFVQYNVLPLGISVDSSPSKKAWALSLGIEHISLLADFWPHGAFANTFGIFREKDGFSERANIIIDDQGKIQWVKVYEISTLPNLDEVFSHL